MAAGRCPVCGARVDAASDALPAHFPFCSQRCRDVDLAGWLAEQYSVPVQTERVAQEAVEEPDDDEPPALDPTKPVWN